MVAKALATRVAGDFCDKYPRSTFENMAKPQGNAEPFPLPEINTYIVQYQDPAQADTMTKIEKELDETKQVLVKNIELVMERGEKLDSLVAKSEDINASSKLFYRQVSRRRTRRSGERMPLMSALNRPRSRTLAALSCEHTSFCTSGPHGVYFSFARNAPYVGFAYLSFNRNMTLV